MSVIDLSAYRLAKARDHLVIFLDDELPYPWHTIERGEKNGEQVYNVCGWRTSPEPALLRRDLRRNVVATFATEADAHLAYPAALTLAGAGANVIELRRSTSPAC